MRKTFQLLHSISKPLRIFFDLLLAALLFFAWFIARGGPRYGEEERFRRAEKANLVGPSVILDKMYVQGDWIPTGYTRLLIGDAGDEILFFAANDGRASRYGVLTRREKTEGILLTTVPQMYTILSTLSALPSSWYGEDVPVWVIPLFLFVDEPAAVRAEVELQLTEDREVTLRQYRGTGAPEEERDWSVREKYFLFSLPIPPETWDSPDAPDAFNALLWTNDPTLTAGGREYPAVIRLYDAEDRLLEARDYVIRSRAADARAS
jgi:hypothetical protein